MKSKPVRVLLIDDDEDDYIVTDDLLSEIRGAKYDLEWVKTYDAALEVIMRRDHDVCLLDLRLGDRNGLDLLREAIEKRCRMPVILLTGQGDHEVDVEAMKAGAADYLVKGQIDVSILERSIRYSIERKQVEEALRASEERFRDIAFSSSDWIWEIDIKWIYTYASGNVVDVLGYRPEELIGKTFFDTIVRDEVAKIKEAFVRIASQRENIVDLVNLNIHKNGHPVCLLTNGVPILDDDGNLLGYRGVDKDITERKRAEELLRQSEQKYRSLIETIHDGVGIVNLDNNLIFANQAACNIFGYSLETLTGMNLSQIVVEKDMGKVYKEGQKRKDKKHGQYELTIRRKDGDLRHVFVSSTPYLGDDGNVNGAVSIITDITDFKKTEEEKQKLREKLVYAQRMESLGLLAGGVAHDLNNILGPLVAYPELMRMKLDPNSPVIHELSQIEKSARRAADVVQDLLTMARRGRYEMVTVDLNEIVESYLQSPDFFELKLKSPGVVIDMDLDKTIPKIYGSAAHLSKVIMNLIINALDAMPHGGRLSIRTQSKYIERLIGGYDNIENGKYIILTVSDTGIGIDGKDFRHLFEPFYTKKSMGRSGSGLGLSIVYGVVKDHNGYVDVRSELGKGSDFLVYFPVVKTADGEAKKVVVDIRGNEKILVVDDLVEQRELAGNVLSSLGYKVETASGGKEAIEYLEKNTADVVILDMLMEDGFDGLDTYRKIKENNSGQKAIIVSGYSETDRVKEAEKLGVGKFVKKPYTMQKLGKAIREVLIT